MPEKGRGTWMATHNRPCPAVERQTLSLPRTRGRSYGGNGGTARQLFLLCRLFLPGGGRQGITGGSTIERRCSRPRVIPPVGISIHERWLATGASSHGRRLRVRRHGEGEALAAHTLTEALLPTTCVVVNKPPALKHFPTIGAQPRLSESRSRVPRNRRSGIPLRGACQKAGGNPARRKTPWGAHDRIGRASQPLGLLRLCRLVLHVHGGATGLGIHVTDGLDRVQPGLYP